MTASIAIARAADIPELLRLMHDFYAESGHEIDVQRARAAFDRVIAEPALGRAWIARIDGAPAGHVVLSVRFAMEVEGLGAIIDDLYVRPAHRRKGIARALLAVLVDDCARRGCRSLQVEVGRANAPAVALYRSLGLAPYADDRITLTGQVPQSRA